MPQKRRGVALLGGLKQIRSWGKMLELDSSSGVNLPNKGKMGEVAEWPKALVC